MFANDSECKNGILIKEQTRPGKSYAVINFTNIEVTDNSGNAPTVTCVGEKRELCQYEMGKEYNFGITGSNGLTVNFKATDKAGNFKECRFTVIVEGLSYAYFFFHTKLLEFCVISKIIN